MNDEKEIRICNMNMQYNKLYIFCFMRHTFLDLSMIFSEIYKKEI